MTTKPDDKASERDTNILQDVLTEHVDGGDDLSGAAAMSDKLEDGIKPAGYYPLTDKSPSSPAFNGMVEALRPLAAIPLWRVTYPDEKGDSLPSPSLRRYITVEHVMNARIALAKADASMENRLENPADQGRDFVAEMAAIWATPTRGVNITEREACAKIADELYDEAPQGSFDNGGTQDGWQMACRKLAELIRAQPAPTAKADASSQTPEGWRTDMENAPKDGTPVDLWSVHGHRVTDLRWIVEPREGVAHQNCITDGWKRVGDHPWGCCSAEQFTHWMPQPSAPPAMLSSTPVLNGNCVDLSGTNQPDPRSSTGNGRFILSVNSEDRFADRVVAAAKTARQRGYNGAYDRYNAPSTEPGSPVAEKLSNADSVVHRESPSLSVDIIARLDELHAATLVGDQIKRIEARYKFLHLIVTAWPQLRKAFPTAPSGWKLVPIEPSPEMLLAGHNAPVDRGARYDNKREAAQLFTAPVYAAMLAAAPTAPSLLSEGE